MGETRVLLSISIGQTFSELPREAAAALEETDSYAGGRLGGENMLPGAIHYVFVRGKTQK